MKYFDIKRDNEYPYFYHACLTGKPESEMSHDTRYCKQCFDILSKEAELDTSWGKGKWKPVSKPSPKPSDAKLGGDKPREVESFRCTTNFVNSRAIYKYS
jgi:hypothetical protein